MRSLPQSSLTTRLARAAAISAVVIVLDQFVKWMVTGWLGPEAEEHARWLVGQAIGFEYVRNTGAAFGLFQDNPELLAAVTVAVAVGIVWLVLTEIASPRWSALSAGLLTGGAVGNFIERVTKGYVTDYVAIGPWPRFNVADASITIGIAIFAVAVVFDGATGEQESTVSEEG